MTRPRTRPWSAARGISTPAWVDNYLQISTPVSTTIPVYLEEPEPVPEPEPEKTVLACPTYSCGDLADFQCSRGKRVVKFELEKTEFALFPSLIHQVRVAAGWAVKVC